LSVDGTGALEIGGSVGVGAGAVGIDAGGEAAGFGTVDAVVVNNGSLDAVGGNFDITGAAGGTGTYGIEATATLEIESEDSSTARVVFRGAGTLQLDAPTAFVGTINAIPSGATIDVVDRADATAGIVGTTLEVKNGSGTLNYTLVGGDYSDVRVSTQPDGKGGTDVILACFAQGTRILTVDGDVAVESLVVGDHVVTAGGKSSPVMWLGFRHVDCRNHTNPRAVWPICVRSGAFGDGRPHRHLLLSPDHAVHIDEVLIPIRHLVNDKTIVREAVDTITYWHVELAHHDVLLAEGLAAESYLDTGNRAEFVNADLRNQSPGDAGPHREAAAFAPLIVCGDLLEHVRSRLAAENCHGA
jgi:collagen type I/II/III/V/XI/XXIV/XXVII alpha